MLIPQGLAYSILAGMPPMYGLYASIFTLLLYAPFSTSPQLAVGPVAMMSLLSNAAISEFEGASCGGGTLTIEHPECNRFINLTLKLAFITGLFSVLLGMLKAGYLVNFLSHPVLKGFTLAAAIVIGSSQISKALGFKIPSHEYVYETWADAVVGISKGKTHGLTFGLFVENMALFYILKYLRTYLRTNPTIKKNKVVLQIVNAFPSALLVVIVNILIVGGLQLNKQGVSIVGKIEPGIPAPVNLFDETFGADFVKLLPSALVMTIVGFMESISVAKAMALRFGNTVDSDQELVGLGMANFVGSFFNSIPSTGGFSRTSVNADAGAKTPLAGMVTSIVLIVVVVFLTGLFEYLPQVTLGSLIIFAVTKLVEFTTPRMLWNVDKGDFLVYIVAFLATIILGIELGIGIGAAISIARVVQQSAMPHVAELGRMPGAAGKWRNVKRFPGKAETLPDIRVFRFDAPVFFANSAAFRDTVLQAAKPSQFKLAPKAIIVDFSAVSSLDSSAVHMLEGMPDELQKQAMTFRRNRIRALESKLKALPEGPALLKDLSSLKPPRATSLDEYHPSLAAAFPANDTDVETLDAATVAARVRELRTSIPRIPVMYVACVRGPVRDILRRNDFFEDCEHVRAEYVNGNVWRCEHPCRCVAPHSMLFVGCRRLPGMPKAPTFKFDAAAAASVPAAAEKDSAAVDEPVVAKEADSHGVELVEAAVHAEDVDESISRRRTSIHPEMSSSEDHVEGGEFADGPSAMDKHHKYPLLQLVLQDQDIDQAVARVRAILSEMDPPAADDLAERGLGVKADSKTDPVAEQAAAAAADDE
jgi:sulfate permease, SulP family